MTRYRFFTTWLLDARAAFAWTHHWVMRRGAEGLARELVAAS